MRNVHRPRRRDPSVVDGLAGGLDPDPSDRPGLLPAKPDERSEQPPEHDVIQEPDEVLFRMSPEDLARESEDGDGPDANDHATETDGTAPLVEAVGAVEDGRNDADTGPLVQPTAEVLKKLDAAPLNEPGAEFPVDYDAPSALESDADSVLQSAVDADLAAEQDQEHIAAQNGGHPEASAEPDQERALSGVAAAEEPNTAQTVEVAAAIQEPVAAEAAAAEAAAVVEAIETVDNADSAFAYAAGEVPDFSGTTLETLSAEEVDPGGFEMGNESGGGSARPDARPIPYEPTEAAPVDDPLLQIRLARIHLKTGSLALARAEFETLAGRNQLDTAAHLDLAEARWRTGDLVGAGEAATAYLDDEGDEALGFVIAAEAAAISNRMADARRHTERALERQLAELDPVFAGISPKAPWPASSWTRTAPEAPKTEQIATESPFWTDAASPATVAPSPRPEARTAGPMAVPHETPADDSVGSAAAPLETESAPTQRDEEGEGEPAAQTAGLAEQAAAEPAAGAPESATRELAEEPEPAAEGLGQSESAAAELPPDAAELPLAASETRTTPRPVAAPKVVAAVEPTTDEARAEVASGRAYLDAGDPMMAALHFGVAIRLAPASANAVLEAIGDRQDLPLQLVRGDALRLLGLEGDAGRAYQSVANALGVPRTAEPAAVTESTDSASAPAEPSGQTEPADRAEPAEALPEPPAPDPSESPAPQRRKRHVDEPPTIRWD